MVQLFNPVYIEHFHIPSSSSQNQEGSASNIADQCIQTQLVSTENKVIQSTKLQSIQVFSNDGLRNKKKAKYTYYNSLLIPFILNDRLKPVLQ